MDILLIGGRSRVMDAVIDKLSKEGHRIYILTGAKHMSYRYRKVFEQYDFPYDSDCLNEVFESVNPDVVLFMGAYDSNFDWNNSKNSSVNYSAGVMNTLIATSKIADARMIYLSSEDVFGCFNRENYTEEDSIRTDNLKALTIAQGENTCLNFAKTSGLDCVILRMDHIFYIPKKRTEVREHCASMCLEAMDTGRIVYQKDKEESLLFISDAVEFLYQIMKHKEHKYPLYHISTSEAISEEEMAKQIQANIGREVILVPSAVGEKKRTVLSNQRFSDEFGIKVFHQPKQLICEMAQYMAKHEKRFQRDGEANGTLLEKLGKNLYGIVMALIPFIENFVCFIPFFMLNNRAVGSEYFANLDFYLLYVLLFAILYGQQQAILSAVLAVAGYLFRQQYTRSGFAIMLDYNTYVWIIQLFILGMVVGYMKDHLKQVKGEGETEIDYLSEQLDDIADINTTNVHIKNILETQIVNQNDSFGKVYEITSKLDQYEPEEVIFYATEVIEKLINSKDVAIYSVENDTYARLFSASSQKARSLGNSIRYQDMDKMYEDIRQNRVYINKDMDEKYPLMSNAIFSGEKLQLIIMVWGITWEHMNLGQANMLKIAGYLIQNAVLHANRYMLALEDERYIGETRILDSKAFTALIHAYNEAKKKNLTECCFIHVSASKEELPSISEKLGNMLRHSDYLGQLSDQKLYVLLSNTSMTDGQKVLSRFLEKGLQAEIQEEVDV